MSFRWLESLKPCHMHCIPGSQLPPGRAIAVVDLHKVSQRMENLLISLSLPSKYKYKTQFQPSPFGSLLLRHQELCVLRHLLGPFSHQMPIAALTVVIIKCANRQCKMFSRGNHSLFSTETHWPN